MIDTTAIPVRHHMLRAIAKCEALALAALRGDEGAPSRNKEKGTTTHALLFNTVRVVVAPMARNEKHAAWREFRDAHDGCRIVTQTEYDEAAYMVDAVRRDKHARELLDAARSFEQTILFDQNGRTCRASPDIIGNTWIADLKTTKDASPEKFAKSVAGYGYHTALEWYLRAVRHAQVAFLIAVEGSGQVAVYELPPADIELAKRLNDRRLAQLRECERTGRWRGYTPDGPTMLALPSWDYDTEAANDLDDDEDDANEAWALGAQP